MVMLTKEGRPAADAKAGRCQPCRDGHCALCASDSCVCPDRRKHTRRPSYGRVNGNGSGARRNGAARRPAARVKPGLEKPLTAPVFELVRADPPEKERKPARTSLVERVRPLLEQLMAEQSRDWHRIALYPRAHAAAPNKGRLAKAYGEFEWRAVRLVEVDQSAVYVRWLGEKRLLGGQL